MRESRVASKWWQKSLVKQSRNRSWLHFMVEKRFKIKKFWIHESMREIRSVKNSILLAYNGSLLNMTYSLRIYSMQGNNTLQNTTIFNPIIYLIQPRSMNKSLTWHSNWKKIMRRNGMKITMISSKSQFRSPGHIFLTS